MNWTPVLGYWRVKGKKTQDVVGNEATARLKQIK
jgi:hypothetical protein